MELFTLIVSVVGAAAWLPWLFERFSPSRIVAKIISLTLIPNQSLDYLDKDGPKHLNGIGYFLKLNIIALNKTINIQKLEVSVKYPNEAKPHQGRIYWARKVRVALEGTPHTLQIPSSQFLPFINILDKDKVVSCYLTFMVDKANFEDFESVILKFIDFRNQSVSAVIGWNEIDHSVMLFEDSVWIPLDRKN